MTVDEALNKLVNVSIQGDIADIYRVKNIVRTVIRAEFAKAVQDTMILVRESGMLTGQQVQDITQALLRYPPDRKGGS